MFSYSQFISQSANALKVIEPTIKSTMTQLVAARNDYSEGRNRLDMEGVCCLALLLPSHSCTDCWLLVARAEIGQ
jgi:hypothetical protein